MSASALRYVIPKIWRWLAWIAFAVVGFAVLLVVMAPSQIVAYAVRTGSEGLADIANPTGSLWNGQGTLIVQQRQLGRLAWQIAPVGFTRLGLDWQWSDVTHNIEGRAELAAGASLTGDASVEGAFEAALLNPALTPYHILLSGRFDIEPSTVRIAEGRPQDVDARMRWSGGSVSYRLSGEHANVLLPPMVGTADYVDGDIVLAANTERSDQPLLKARLDGEGWMHIGVTKLFMALAGQPWPGTAPPETFVVEVAEKIL